MSLENNQVNTEIEMPLEHTDEPTCETVSTPIVQECKKEELDKVSSKQITKVEAFLMFVILLIIMVASPMTIQKTVMESRDQNLTQISTLANRVSVLEEQVEQLLAQQTQMKTMLDAQKNSGSPVNVTLNIDGENKKYTYNPETEQMEEIETIEGTEDSAATEEFDTSPFLGVAFTDVEAAKTPLGLKVEYVYEHSPAEFCGIQAGDIIMAIDGTAIMSFEDLDAVISQHQANDEITLQVATTTDTGINVVSYTASLTQRGNYDFGDETE